MQKTIHWPRRTSISIDCVAHEGLGFGEGLLSVATYDRDGVLERRTIQRVQEAVRDKKMYRTVERQDDGCGDGRPVVSVTANNNDHSALLRAKVFGGGLVTAASMWRVLDGAPRNGQKVLGDRGFIADQLDSLSVMYGGHVDELSQGVDIGCGAIDHYEAISRAIVTYRDEISSILPRLYGRTYDEVLPYVDSVFARYTQLFEYPEYFTNSSGSHAFDVLREHGALIPTLAGFHREVAVVLNDIRDTTFDQQRLFRVTQRHIDTSKRAQVFSIDTWRGADYAAVVASIACRIAGDDEQYEQRRMMAHADFLIRSVAVIATLTTGDLPVFVRRQS